MGIRARSGALAVACLGPGQRHFTRRFCLAYGGMQYMQCASCGPSRNSVPEATQPTMEDQRATSCKVHTRCCRPCGAGCSDSRRHARYLRLHRGSEGKWLRALDNTGQPVLRDGHIRLRPGDPAPRERERPLCVFRACPIRDDHDGPGGRLCLSDRPYTGSSALHVAIPGLGARWSP
jgi:hypothetical protein